MRGLLDINMMTSDYYSYPCHKHAEWEVLYYIKGSGINIIGDERFPFTEGTVICQPPGILHAETSKVGYRNIHFLVKDMDDFDIKVPVFSDGPNPECEYLLSQAQFLWHKHKSHWAATIEAILLLFTEFLLAYNAEDIKSPIVDQCERLIEDNIQNQDFILRDFYEQLPISRDHFIRLFKKETGRTPYDYLLDRRIDYAKYLLRKRHELNYRIKDVAQMSGFNDNLYFSRLFKKKTGFTPKSMYP